MLEWRLYILEVPGRFIHGSFSLLPTLNGSDSEDSYLSANEQVFAAYTNGQMPAVSARTSPSGAVVELMGCTISGYLVKYK
jgi:hypothetical protein